MNTGKLKNYLLLYAAFFIYSISAVCSKMASKQDQAILLMVFLGAEIVFLGLYALVYQKALKRFPLAVAMANKGITVIFALIWSVILFKENITAWNILGCIIIIAGIGMVSTDD